MGHFPEEPVMPGVLLVEAMAQTGGLLVLQGLEDAERYSTYFLKIDNVKFRQKVVPGDTLIFTSNDRAHAAWLLYHERICFCGRKNRCRSRIYGSNRKKTNNINERYKPKNLEI